MKFSHFVLSVFLGLCSFYASAFDPAEPAPFTIKIDGTGHERVVASAYDNDANLYVAGYYQNGSNTTISSFSDGPNTDGQRVLDTYNTLPENNGGQDLFIAKFNWQGQIQWIKFAGGLGKDGATGIAFDRKSGQLFVTGYIQGSVDFALTQVNATGNSSGLDNDTSTNLFISVLDVTTGEWLDIQTFPLVAEVTDTLDNPVGGAHIQNLEITGGDRALGNGITIAQDESDVSAPVVFYIKGQVKNTHQIVSNMTPANGETWLARLALNTTVPANSDTYTVADLLGSGGNTSTSGSGHWSFITKVSYIENPNPLVGQVRWNWDWLTQLNQGVTPIQGASDAYVESCYAVDTGNNLIIEQQSASDNSNVWNLDQNIDAGSPQYALQFNDPLPSGATLTSIAVGVDFSLLLGNELGPISYNFNAAMEGITLGEYSIPPTLAPVSPPAYFPASTTINYNSSLATYNEGGQNTLVFNHVAGESIKLTKVVLTLNYLSQTGEPCHMDVVTDMEVDPAQGLSSPLYFSGEWRSGFKIASDTYESEEGGRNGYVASLTPNGNWRFFAQVKGYSSIQGIEFNAESNLIATGFAGLSSDSASNVTFDSSGLLPNPAALTPGTYGTTSALFAEINGNGQWLWGAVNTSVAASFDLKKSLDGSFITTGTTTSDSSTNTFVARFADANNANFIWTQTNSENATFGYHLLVNNLDSLYVFGGTQQHYSAPYTTSLTNNTVAYSDIDDTTADQLTGLGTQIHVLDPVSGEFQTDFQNYHEYVVGNLITPQITGDNFQNTLSMRRSIPTNIGIENTTNGNGIPLNEPLLTIQADLAIYAGGPIDQAVILWPSINNTQFAYQPLVGKAVRIRWPSVEEGLQEYLYSITEGVEIPNIPLNPPGATENYQWFQFSETLAGEPQTEGTISNAQEELVTTATRMGSLVFFPGGNTATEHPTVVSIRSYPWDDENKHTDNIGLEIGTTAPAPANLVLDGVDAGGYVMTPLGRYDTKTEVYERETRLGQIIPVNLNGEEDIDGEAGGDYADDLRVAWYQQGAVNLNWPFVAHSYTPFWPTDPGLIVLASQLGSGGLKDGVEQQQEGMIPSDPDTSDTTIYYQNDRTVPGFNPNEEHAHLVAKTGLYVAHAIRNDLNNLYQLTSDPYVLVRYYYGPLAEYRYRIFKVDYSSDDYPNFQLTSQAGNKVPAPNYFSDWVASNTHPANDATDDAFYIDRNDEVWSRSAETNIDVNYFYEITNDSFWYDVDGVEGADVVLGGQIPWMNFHNEGEGDTSVPHTLTYINSWPEDIITVYIGDTLFGNISNKKHIRILYDENDVIDDVDPSDLNRDVNATLRMFNFEAEIAALDTDGITYAVVGTNVVITRGDDSLSLPTRRRPLKGPNIFDFPQLPSDLRARVRFAEQTGTSQGGYFYFLGGNFDADTGEQIDIDTGIQMINVMTDFEREKLKRFDNTGNRPFANTVDNNADSPWDDVVDALYNITRNPSGIDRDGIAGPDQELLVGLEQREGTNRLQHSVVDASVALTAAFATQPGYVVIGENLIAEPDGDDNPVSLEVYRVEDSLEAGSINVFRNHLNHLDTRLVVRHGLDFSGNSDDLLFEWYWTNAMGEEGGVPEFELDSENRPIGWLPLLTGTAREGAATYYLDSGKPLLSDGYIFVRYKGLATEADPTGDRWSDLAGVSVLPTEAPIPKKIEGWVKRVMSNIETYEQRYTDFNENEINSYSSMLVQAGPEYTSDVALTGEDGALNEVGLIELYQTILNYAIDLSIESGAVVDDDAVNTQLLYAASRIASLYMLIGNEAFSDAMDPTIGVISDGGTSYLQPSLFAFQNSLDSLIEEELGLLRGLDSKNPATGNRLLWNLVNTEAEAAYVQVYGIADTDGNGVENEAQANFPQGHGDAWGHYLSANKLYYSLARHPNYDWKPFTDTSTIVSGITGVLDYKDEQRFASSAAAKARTGARIVDLTFRNEYSHSPQAQWRGYKDNDDQRAWGMDGWARRAGQGAVLDWALANALLPYEDTTGTGIQKIDRKTTATISEIPVALLEIDSIVSRADRGNNPFGVASDSIPFDIDASKLRDGESHFEQVYVRAKDAANNSVQLFNYANELTQEIRMGQISNAEFQQLEDEKERDFKDRLIELMGYPYSGNVGPGKIYPTGYNGPDLYQYRYIDSDLPDVAPSLISSITVEFPNLDDEDCESGCETSINNYLFNSDMSSNTNPDDNVGFINANGRLVLDFPVSSGSNYPYIKPNDSWGARPAPGKLQLQLSEMQLIQARINTTLAEQQALMANIEAEVNLLESIYDIRSDQIQTYDGLKDNYRALSGSLAAMRTLSNNLVLWGESIYRWAGIYHNTTSTSVGFSNDIGFIPRLGISATYSALTAGLITSSGLVSTAQFALQSGVEQAAFNRSIVAQKSGYPLEVQRQLTVIEKLMNEEIKYRYSLVELYQEFDNSQSVFQQLEAEAIRILGERIEFRKSVASRVTNDRYRDMTYRVFRNDALQKYRASFDLAAKYTYLAAKAFDYETGLLSDDGNGIDQSFYESLVRQRALGQYTDDGDPIAGVKGLSTPLARMASAFSSAESAFGGLDPLEQEFNFSLRQEAYRIVNGGQGADRWRRLLQNGIVSDLWNVPEFTEFCVPPGVSAEDGPLEGIVLRFGTTIHLDKNLFGWDKGSVDSTYSASYSATKFYRVGLHFDDYPDELVNTPYAYLVPVGTDFLRSPTDITQLRSYQVFDQAIPVPTDLTSGDTSYEEEGWIPGNDSVLTRWDRRRRFSDIPVSTDPVFDFDAVTTSGRLVGRSVWNTEWVLIIPGKSLAADGGLGIQTLINGDNANPTNEGISDIRLVFDTYSFPAQ